MSAVSEKSEKSGRTTDKLTMVIIGLVFSGITIFGAAFLSVQLSEDLYDPFGEFPVQTVHNELEYRTPPAAALGEPFEVEGTKCYTEAVEILGTVRWKMVSPYVRFIETSWSGNANRTEGCATAFFVNEWPAEAITLTAGLFATGEEVVIWQVTGEETPAIGGVTKIWETQNVSVYPRTEG